MSLSMMILLACLMVAASFNVSAEETVQDIPLEPQRLWTREADRGSMEKRDGRIVVRHDGAKDWAIDLCKTFPVQAGETFLLSGRVADMEGEGRVSLTAALFAADGKIIDWNFGEDSVRGKAGEKLLETGFIVPDGDGYTIRPRLVGYGVNSFSAGDFELVKTGRIRLDGAAVELTGTEEFRYPVSRDDAPAAWLLRSRGLSATGISVDDSLRLEDRATLRVEGNAERRSTLISKLAVVALPGERFFVSCRVRLDGGKVSLDVLPWKNGLPAGGRIASGTFAPSVLEEGNDWANIHVYLTVPEGVEAFCPVLVAEPGTTYRIGELSVRRPAADEVDRPARKVDGWAEHRVEEYLERGLVALRTGEGVYLSWRLLKVDAPDVAFNVYRHDGENEVKLNETPITETTDFLDRDAPKGEGLRWSVRVSTEGRRIRSLPPFYQSREVAALDKPYISIPLKDETSFSRIAFADLDGDQRLDYLVKTPNANIDPYINYWKPSPGTHKLQAYDADGKFLWQKDLGWGIEQGIWYSPCLVADLDGDGCAEVAVKTGPDGDPRNVTGRVYSGPEYLSILDGKTGRERTRIDWPERDGLPYNLSNRHQLCLAYLDGKTPCLIVLRGTYSRMVAVAYQFRDDKLEELWRYDNRWHRELWGQGAHTTHAADLDGDGRDEVILGSVVLDDDGSVLWSTGLGHPDHVYFGDLDPERPGLEILYGIERRNPENAICMVDARSGEVLWGIDHPSKHIHSTGMCSDIDARFPGCESWAGEQDSEAERWLRTARGEVIELPEQWSRRNLAPKTVWWDADPQRELIHDGRPVDFPSFERVGDVRFEGSIRLVADVIGDGREEVITSHKGEIRIYTTTIPAESRRTTLLQSPNYRATLHESSMGYPQTPLP